MRIGYPISIIRLSIKAGHQSLPLPKKIAVDILKAAIDCARVLERLKRNSFSISRPMVKSKTILSTVITDTDVASMPTISITIHTSQFHFSASGKAAFFIESSIIAIASQTLASTVPKLPSDFVCPYCCRQRHSVT